MGDVPLSWRVVVSKVTAWAALQSSSWRNTRGLQTAFIADYVLGISIYIHATVWSFGPLLDTSAIRGKNMKHSDFNKGTSPTMGDARPVYTTVFSILAPQPTAWNRSEKVGTHQHGVFGCVRIHTGQWGGGGGGGAFTFCEHWSWIISSVTLVSSSIRSYIWVVHVSSSVILLKSVMIQLLFAYPVSPTWVVLLIRFMFSWKQCNAFCGPVLTSPSFKITDALFFANQLKLIRDNLFRVHCVLSRSPNVMNQASGKTERLLEANKQREKTIFFCKM